MGIGSWSIVVAEGGWGIGIKMVGSWSIGVAEGFLHSLPGSEGRISMRRGIVKNVMVVGVGVGVDVGVGVGHRR